MYVRVYACMHTHVHTHVRAEEDSTKRAGACASVCVRRARVCECAASMWITRVRVRDPLSLSFSLFLFLSSRRIFSSLSALLLSLRAVRVVPYLWSFPYDALGSELGCTYCSTCVHLPIACNQPAAVASSEGTIPNLDRFTLKQVCREKIERERERTRYLERISAYLGVSTAAVIST